LGGRRTSSRRARLLIEDRANAPVFRAASFWEIAIKSALGRDDFQVDPALLRGGLLAAGYDELAISASHTMATAALPALHKDPFDRMLVAQARVEGLLLLTAGAAVAAYRGAIEKV